MIGFLCGVILSITVGAAVVWWWTIPPDDIDDRPLDDRDW